MKTITVKDFDKAVPEVAARITMRHLDKIEATLMFTMSGIAFAKELREELFGKEDEE
jgi:hypothetical protein